jgi:tRNA (guanine37-N1)-methyltransferase
VLGDFDSAESDSFHSGLLDCAYYTRPAEFAGQGARTCCSPATTEDRALSGGRDALRRTFDRRPDLLERSELDAADRKFLRTLTGEPEPVAPRQGEEAARTRTQESPKETP